MIPVLGKALPTSGALSFMYYRGKRDDGTDHYHRGIDLPAPLGTPVYAAEGGTVEWANRQWVSGFSGYGKVVVIKSDSRNVRFLYAHLNDVFVNKGNKVSAGTKIGAVGYTAFSRENPTGSLENRAAHLHFEAADKPYPMLSEAERLNPLVVLATTTAGMVGGGLIIALGLGGLLSWYLIKRRKK